MKKQDNKLALSVLSTLITGIIFIYTLVMYHDVLIAVIGTSLLFLITAYILTQKLIHFSASQHSSFSFQLKDSVNDISSQLEAMNGVQSQIGKATYLYVRQAAQAAASLENNYAESQQTLYKNLISLTNNQNKATRLMIKYDQSNTDKVISTIKDMKNHLGETMTEGFDHIQPDSDSIIAALTEITNYLKSQSGNMDQTLQTQLNNVAHELQNISNSIQYMKAPSQNTAPVHYTEAPANNMPPAGSVDIPPVTGNYESDEAFTGDYTDSEFETAGSFENEPANAYEADIHAEGSPMENEIIPDEAVTDDTPSMPVFTVIDNTSNGTPDISSDDVTDADMAEFTSDDIINTESDVSIDAPDTDIPISDSENSMDTNAPVFDSEDSMDTNTPVFDFENGMDTTPVSGSENDMDTNTPVSISEDSLSPDEPTAPADDNTESTLQNLSETPQAEAVAAPQDLNKQLSSDEIAALFAAADPAPKKEPKPAPAAPENNTTTATLEPAPQDLNKQLSSDEIAALFAAADPAPKKEAKPAEPAAPKDPNQKLSADEIAALFASMG